MFFESSSDGFIFVHKKTESTFSGCLKNSYKTKKVITHLLLTLRNEKQDINNLNYVGLCDKMKKTNKKQY